MIMSDISPIGRPSGTTLNSTERVQRHDPRPGSPSRGKDKAEFSTTAQMLSKMADMPEVRQDLVDRVRSEIKLGNYETPEKIDAAIDSLLDSFDEEI